jgi:glutamine synthetase
MLLASPRRDRARPRCGHVVPITTSSRRRTATSAGAGLLTEALDALEADHDFLLSGDVFSTGLIETWIAWKRENEGDTVRLRPRTPAEFALYFDC